MEYLCTTCSKRKRREVKPLPALERYWSRRIRWVWKKCQRGQKPLLIFSGKYGLLTVSTKIPWYDHALQPAEVEDMACKLVKQLSAKRVSQLTFYALPKNTRGWRPYYAALEKACASLGIPLAVKILKAVL